MSGVELCVGPKCPGPKCVGPKCSGPKSVGPKCDLVRNVSQPPSDAYFKVLYVFYLIWFNRTNGISIESENQL